MKHYYCPDCAQNVSEMSVCETEACTSQWEIMNECDCADGNHGAGTKKLQVVDCHGNQLEDGDNVTLIKDLTLRGTSQVIKRGTKVKGIRLTDNADEIDCKINGSGIVLRTEVLKKI